MIEILSISVAILALALVGLVIYIFKLNKEKQFVDKNSDPDFIKLQKDYEGLDKEINLKDQYISDLKKDKQELIQNRADVDSFKDISNKSFQEYNSLVQEYRNFHEKLIGNFKYQGAYNEKKLQRLLEKNGLVKDQDFTVREGQISKDITTGETRRVNPDFIITLPEGDTIVIDCKVSLKNFESFANEKDPKLRDHHIKKHVTSVKDHIKSLSKKPYTKIYNLKSFEYVIMFMPWDTCYLSAIENDSELLDFATDNNVILAGPISIMPLIANVKTLKNQSKQLSIVDNIVNDATNVWDKYTVIRSNIKSLLASFKTHRNSIESLINNTYVKKNSLENLMLDLKKNNGIEGQKLDETTENEKAVPDVEDIEEKKTTSNIN